MSALNEGERPLEDGSDDCLDCFEKERAYLSLKRRHSSLGHRFPPSSNYFVAMETHVFDESHLNRVLGMLTGYSSSYVSGKNKAFE